MRQISGNASIDLEIPPSPYDGDWEAYANFGLSGCGPITPTVDVDESCPEGYGIVVNLDWIKDKIELRLDIEGARSLSLLLGQAADRLSVASHQGSSPAPHDPASAGGAGH